MTWLKYSECFGKQMYLYWLLRFILWNQCPDEVPLLTALILSGSILGKKRSLLYYIGWSGDEDIIERPLGDLDGFVEHLERIQDCRKDICSKRRWMPD